MNSNVTVIDHPLVQHKLSLLREKDRSTSGFRTLLAEISMLLVYEVTRDLKLTYRTIETPLATMQAPCIDGKKVVVVTGLKQTDYRDEKGKKQNTPSFVTTTVYFACK